MTTWVRRGSPVRIVVALLLVGVLAGCSGGSDAPTDARALLKQAKQTVDQTSAVHFTLGTKDLPTGGGTVLTGGEGVAVRPDSFTGTLTVRLGGTPATVEVRSVGGQFYAKLPFSDELTPVDPAAVGFGDPAQFLDKTDGVSSLLTSATETKVTGQKRIDGEVVDVVAVTLPGQAVADLLTSKDPSQDVTGTVAIAADGHQVRQVSLTGPFFSADQDSTVTLRLDGYGDTVEIDAPS